MEKFPLSKPIHVNGAEVSELPYDFEGMSATDKAAATKAYKKAGNVVSVQELDPDYHLYLFAGAVKKADSSIDIEDVLRISAKDAVKAESLARDFFFDGSAE